MSEKFTRLWATKNKDDEWWSSFVTSPLAIAASYAAVDVRWVTPNLITLLSFIVALASVLLIVIGGTGNFIVAAILIQAGHALDCMDGQIARYRQTPSVAGSYFDKVTDHIQVALWFGAVGYAAHNQTQDVLPIFLAFTGVAFYSLRGYVKYVTIFSEISRDPHYLEKKARQEADIRPPDSAGPGFSAAANFAWLLREQRKVLFFDEGVLVFMLSLSLILNTLMPMLWLFAASQLFWGLARALQRGCQIERNQNSTITK